MLKPYLSLFLILTALVLISSAQEPVKSPLGPRIITATRQVAVFTDLENQLLRAVQKKDQTTLGGLVTDDCSIQMPDAEPLPAEDWIQSVMDKRYSLKSFQVRQVSALDMSDYVLVNFDRLQQATYQGKSDSGEFFVVDQWKKSGDSWKLANRYVAKVSSVPWAPKGDTKPTGKQ